MVLLSLNQNQKVTFVRNPKTAAFGTRGDWKTERKDIGGKSFDVCVIGGGATGAGCALDAQQRGLSALMLDAGDFAGATSSAATKIIHGGVRYLEEAVQDMDPKEYHVVVRHD